MPKRSRNGAVLRDATLSGATMGRTMTAAPTLVTTPVQPQTASERHDSRVRGGGCGGGGGGSVTGAIPVVPVAEPVQPQIAAVAGKARAEDLMPKLARLEEQLRTLISNTAAAKQQTVPIDLLKKLNRDKPPHEPLIPIPHGDQAHPPFFPAGLTKSGIFTLTDEEVTAVLVGYGVEFDEADTHAIKCAKLVHFLTGF